MNGTLLEKIKNKETSLAVVGLGYVGMPIAVAFAEKGIAVIGFDNNKAKIELYKSGIDPTKEVGDEVIENTTLRFTSDPSATAGRSHPMRAGIWLPTIQIKAGLCRRAVSVISSMSL